MNSLFSIFDPSIGITHMNFNWGSSLWLMLWMPFPFFLLKSGPFSLVKNVIQILHNEIKLNFNPWSTPGMTHWIVSIFLFLVLNNSLGLLPYTFTATSHLSFSLTLGLSSWVGYMLYSMVLEINHNLAHFVPLGTPYILMPFMVLIEIISNMIRPLTLSVRLAANMVAGHLLLVLISSPACLASWGVLFGIMSGIILMMVLESAVAFIQAYVFSMLSSLYISEVNFGKLNYLMIELIYKVMNNFFYKILFLPLALGEFN